MIQNTRSSSLLLPSNRKSHCSQFHKDNNLENGLDNANMRRALKRERKLVPPERSKAAAHFALETMVRRVTPRPSLKNTSRNTTSEPINIFFEGAEIDLISFKYTSE